jgi:hypothetical protein
MPRTPFSLAFFQIVVEKHEGRREQDAPFAGQRAFFHDLTVEVGDFARTPQVELQDFEILADEVLDLMIGEIDQMGFLTIRAALLFPNDGETLAGFLGFGKIFTQDQKAVQKPALMVHPVFAKEGFVGNAHRASAARHRGKGCSHTGDCAEFTSADHR